VAQNRFFSFAGSILLTSTSKTVREFPLNSDVGPVGLRHVTDCGNSCNIRRLSRQENVSSKKECRKIRMKSAQFNVMGGFFKAFVDRRGADDVNGGAKKWPRG
jgi:hypothetical protein